MLLGILRCPLTTFYTFFFYNFLQLFILFDNFLAFIFFILFGNSFNNFLSFLLTQSIKGNLNKHRMVLVKISHTINLYELNLLKDFLHILFCFLSEIFDKKLLCGGDSTFFTFSFFSSPNNQHFSPLLITKQRKV